MKEHPISKGFTCPKAVAAVENAKSLNRLKYPLKKADGDWKRISWDEALDTISNKLTGLKASLGPESLAYLLGDAICIGGSSDMNLPFRFCDIYGTPNRFTPGSFCSEMKFIASMYTSGRLYPLVSVSEDSKCIIIWGHNPTNSQPSAVKIISRMHQKGGKLIVIDPRTTYFAKGSEIHAKVRPGSDCALALAILNVVVEENLYDREFVEKWTVGFDKLRDHLRDYGPEKVEEISWVKAEDIRKIARLFSCEKPASILRGVNSLDQNPSGFNLHRALYILEAITGNLDISGGAVASPLPNYRSITLPEMVKKKPIGADQYPLLCVSGFMMIEGQSNLLAQTILTRDPYPIEMMVISGSNPVLVMPNSNKFKAALEKLDFLVVMDLFMTDTAKLANLVLPAASAFERFDLVDFYPIIDGVPYIVLRKKVVDEYFESWSDIRFWLALSHRMGYGDYFPWVNEAELFDHILEPMKISTRYLIEEKPAGLLFDTFRYREYEEKGFPTTSGKVEIYSEALEKKGYDPLPVYKEPIESPANIELFNEYPLILTTGARLLEFYHSQFRNIQALSRRKPEATAQINPVSAKKYGIKDKDIISVETKRGSIEIRAEVTIDIVPGVINISHGWTGANVNVLTDETPYDPVLGYPSLKCQLCKIKR